MKRLMTEKNGFPKPLGMLIIMVIIMVTSFVNLVFSGDGPSTGFQEVHQVNEAIFTPSPRV